MPYYYDQWGQRYGTADMPFDYNQYSEIPGMENMQVGEIAAPANPAIVNANAMFPQDPVNWIALTGTGNVIPGDDVGSILATVNQWQMVLYGSTELGQVRHSSGYLYADPTAGIRRGLSEIPRIVLPPHANVANRR